MSSFEAKLVELSNRYPVAAMLHRVLRKHDIPYFANHSILPALEELAWEKASTVEKYRELLLEELTRAFEDVLMVQVIDIENDPNSQDTPRRLAKMYLNELMRGRYYPTPKITAFPNDRPQPVDAPSCESTPGETEIYHFNNLLVVQSPFKSICSHHHAIVTGIAYVGIIPGKKLIGLSKYTRLVQHIAARGTLQEELTIDIAEAVQEFTESADVAVTVFARHGCCENRGIAVHNSQTSTAEMRGLFMNNPTLRKEFYDNVSMMRKENN